MESIIYAQQLRTVVPIGYVCANEQNMLGSDNILAEVFSRVDLENQLPARWTCPQCLPWAVTGSTCTHAAEEENVER